MLTNHDAQELPARSSGMSFDPKIFSIAVASSSLWTKIHICMFVPFGMENVPFLALLPGLGLQCHTR